MVGSPKERCALESRWRPGMTKRLTTGRGVSCGRRRDPDQTSLFAGRRGSTAPKRNRTAPSGEGLQPGPFEQRPVFRGGDGFELASRRRPRGRRRPRRKTARRSLAPASIAATARTSNDVRSARTGAPRAHSGGQTGSECAASASTTPPSETRPRGLRGSPGPGCHLAHRRPCIAVDLQFPRLTRIHSLLRIC